MFRRLKEKISEEVSKSPLRLQTSVQTLGQLSPFKDGEVKNDLDASKDSSTSNSSLPNLIDLQESDSSILDSSESKQFSITDDDTTPSSPVSKPAEFTNVDLSEKDVGLLNISTDHQQTTGLTKSTISPHSLFPVYNPSTPIYHIQSDLESASEVEDSTLNLDSVSKDRLYQAFQTAKSRYRMYKGRYSNAVKAYKEQTDEIGKIKVVLAETQDRTLRRVSELKEQSQLDQKAKAHLEDTYRVNLEEKDQLISVLHTQIRLLKNGESVNEQPDEPLIDIEQQSDEISVNPESENELRAKVKRYEETIDRLKGFLKNCKETITKNREITTRLNSEKEDIKKQFESTIVRLSELEQKSSMKDIELQNVKTEALEEINRLKKNETERGLQLAQYKRSMHDEMSGKEKETESLKIQLKEIMSNNDDLRKKIESQAKQITELENSSSSAANLKHSLDQLEKTSEEEKQSLLQELSRSKSAAIEVMQQEYQRNIKDLKNENNETVNKLEMEWQVKFRLKIEELEQQITTSKSNEVECADLKNQIMQFELQMTELGKVRDELERLNVGYTDIQSQLVEEQKLKQESLQLSEDLRDRLKEAEEMVDVERSKCEKLKEVMEQDREGQKRDVADEVEMQEIKQQLEDERVKVNNLIVEKQQLESTHEKQVLDVRQQLTQEIDNFDGVCRNLKEELEATKSQLNSCLSSNEQQVTQMKGDIEDKQTQYEALKSQNELQEVKIREIVTEIEELRSKFIASLEEKNHVQFKFDEHLQSSEDIEIKLREDHNRQLLEVKNKTQESISVLKARLEEVQEQLTEEKASSKHVSENSEKEIRSLENLLDLERKKNEENEQKLLVLSTRSDDLSSTENELQTKLAKMSDEIDRLQQNMSTTEASLSQCQTERDLAVSSTEEIGKKLLQMESDYLEAAKQISLLGRERDEVNSETSSILNILSIEDLGERLAKLEELHSNELSQKLKQLFEDQTDHCLKLENSVKEADVRLQSVLSDFSSLNDLNVELETQKEGFINEIQSLQDELRKVKEENVDFRINVDELKSEITARQQEIRSLQDQNCNIGELELRLKVDEEAIEHLNEELKQCREEHSLELEKSTLAERELQDKFDVFKTEKLTFIEQLEQDKTELEKRMNMSNEECERFWKVKLDSSNEEHQTKLSDLKKRAENKLGQIKKQMAADAEKVKVELLAQIKQLEQQNVDDKNCHKESLDKLQKDNDTILELTQQLESLKNSQEEERVSLLTSLEATKEELEQEKVKLSAEIETKNSQLDESLISAQVNCTKMETEMSILQDEMDKERITWKERESELEQLLQTLHEDKLRAIDVDQHQTEIEALNKHHEHILNEKEAAFNSKMKEMVEEFSRSALLREEEERQQLADTIERTLNEDNEIRKECNQQIVEIQKQLSDREQSLEQLIEDNHKLLEEKDKEMKSVSESYEERIKLFRNEHQQELDALEKKLKAAMKRELEYQSRSHETEVRGLSDEWDHERKLFTEDDFNSMDKIEIVQEELERQAQLATSAMESGAQSSELLQRQIRLLQNQIETLKDQHKSEVNELRQVLNMSNHPVPDNLFHKAQFRDRQLETLEIEYLRNILYEYMMGRETLVLAKVIAAVLKFDEDQTKKILEKEEIRVGSPAGSFVHLLK